MEVDTRGPRIVTLANKMGKTQNESSFRGIPEKSLAESLDQTIKTANKGQKQRCTSSQQKVAQMGKSNSSSLSEVLTPGGELPNTCLLDEKTISTAGTNSSLSLSKHEVSEMFSEADSDISFRTHGTIVDNSFGIDPALGTRHDVEDDDETEVGKFDDFDWVTESKAKMNDTSVKEGKKQNIVAEMQNDNQQGGTVEKKKKKMVLKVKAGQLSVSEHAGVIKLKSSQLGGAMKGKPLRVKASDLSKTSHNAGFDIESLENAIKVWKFNQLGISDSNAGEQLASGNRTKSRGRHQDDYRQPRVRSMSRTRAMRESVELTNRRHDENDSNDHRRTRHSHSVSQRSVADLASPAVSKSNSCDIASPKRRSRSISHATKAREDAGEKARTSRSRSVARRAAESVNADEVARRSRSLSRPTVEASGEFVTLSHRSSSRLRPTGTEKDKPRASQRSRSTARATRDEKERTTSTYKSSSAVQHGIEGEPLHRSSTDASASKQHSPKRRSRSVVRKSELKKRDESDGNHALVGNASSSKARSRGNECNTGTPAETNRSMSRSRPRRSAKEAEEEKCRQSRRPSMNKTPSKRLLGPETIKKLSEEQ